MIPSFIPSGKSSVEPEDLVQSDDQSIFFSLVEGMDLPKYRVLNHDYRWIKRNACVRNANHPKFNELMEFIKRKILNEN